MSINLTQEQDILGCVWYEGQRAYSLALVHQVKKSRILLSCFVQLFHSDSWFHY